VIAIPKSKLLVADEMFGLHPALAPLTKYWNAGSFGAVHATGMARPNRSHFAAMEEIEDADPDSSTRQGWVNRLIGLTGSRSPFEAINVNSSSAPTLISGAEPALATAGLSDLHLAGANPEYDDLDWRTRRRSSLARVWADAAVGTPEALLATGVTSAINVSTTLEAFTGDDPHNGATYPTTWPGADLADALKDTATLIRANLPITAITLDFGPWDYHTNYGTLDGGLMKSNLGALATNLDAFMTDLGTDASRVTIVTISEFGRRIGENSAHGLDHGWGNVMLMLGAGIKGGAFHGTWPGLDSSASSLTDDDVAVTTDYRDVLSEILGNRFPDLATRDVFPGFIPHPIGVTRA
jgi:uncharacterized protein (DUF1501 family)